MPPGAFIGTSRSIRYATAHRQPYMRRISNLGWLRVSRAWREAGVGSQSKDCGRPSQTHATAETQRAQGMHHS